MAPSLPFILMILLEIFGEVLAKEWRVKSGPEGRGRCFEVVGCASCEPRARSLPAGNWRLRLHRLHLIDSMHGHVQELFAGSMQLPRYHPTERVAASNAPMQRESCRVTQSQTLSSLVVFYCDRSRKCNEQDGSDILRTSAESSRRGVSR